MTRAETLKALTTDSAGCDVVVSGGGITGAGVAREAAGSGLRTLLVEQKDFSWGTSSRSSKMVHGGLRYLGSGHYGLTRDAVRERERLMAEAPGLLEGYQTLHRLFSESSFNADEITVVWQTINVENACHYCVPAHTGIAKSMKVSDEIIDALRDEKALPDDKLEALRTFTLKVMRQHGNLKQQDMDDFFAAGYQQRHVLEVILGLAQKVMSNYTNHLAETPVDKPFEKFAWSKKG